MSTPSSNDQVIQPAQDGELTPPPPAPESEVAATPEGDDFLRLNRKELSKEIDRLQGEDPEFARIWSTKMGDAAKKRWEPQVKARESRITELEWEVRRREILGMTPEEIEKQFEADEKFALDYAKAVHTKPHESAAPVDETPIITQAWIGLRDRAAKAGLPKNIWDEIETKAAEGGYTETPDEHWSSVLQTIQFDVTERLLKLGKAAPDPASTVNPNLVKPGPDPSGGDAGGATDATWPKSLSEFKKLPTEDQRNLLRQEGGQERMQTLMATPG